MSQLRNQVLDYYGNLVNQIDLKCEKAILFFKKEEEISEINANREKIISKIKQVEKIKMDKIKDSSTLNDVIFSFFISKDIDVDSDMESDIDESDHEYDSDEDEQSNDDSNSENESDEEMDEGSNNESNNESNKQSKKDLKTKIKSESEPFIWRIAQKIGEKFDFSRHIGQLVIISTSLKMNNIKRLMREEMDDDDDDDFENESIKIQIFVQLILSKKDQVIIDLSQVENNKIEKLKLNLEVLEMEENGLDEFELISTYINVDSVKELKLINYIDCELPNKLFKPFKNLTRLRLNLPDCDCLNEDTFIGMGNLEALEINKMSIMLEKNTFKHLVNLKELILDRIQFLKFEKLNGLEKLLKLKIKNCMLDNFRLDFLSSLKSLEHFQILGSDNLNINAKSFDGFENLKVFESDLKETINFRRNLEVLSLQDQYFNFKHSFNALKFLNIRSEFTLKDINFLNQLNQLEFLDFKLPNKLTRYFNQINLPSLKYLVLTCRNTPNFNKSLKNLQGLELIEPKFTPRDEFVNLINLDYLAITDPEESMFNKFFKTNFKTIKSLKFLKIESSDLAIHNENKQKSVDQALLKLFESPENVVSINSYEYIFAIEMAAKLGDEKITERLYFEKYLQVSDCIREFILDSNSNYYKTFFRNTKRRLINFYLDEDTSDDSCTESDDFDGYCGGFGGYDSDDKYMLGFGTYGTTWDEWCDYGSD